MYHHISSFIIPWNHISSSHIIYHHTSSCIIICHQISPAIITCHHISSSIITPHHTSSYVILYHHICRGQHGLGACRCSTKFSNPPTLQLHGRVYPPITPTLEYPPLSRSFGGRGGSVFFPAHLILPWKNSVFQTFWT